MFRLVFESICPRTHRKVVETGPWTAKKQDAQRWMEYFREHTVRQRIHVESAGGEVITAAVVS